MFLNIWKQKQKIQKTKKKKKPIKVINKYISLSFISTRVMVIKGFIDRIC